MLPVTVALLASLTAALLVLIVLTTRRRRKPPARSSAKWQPSVEHREIPRPKEDPVVSWTMPPVEAFLPGNLPLQHFPMNPALRGQLDSFALGRVKRILDAPSIAEHAAADADSWTLVSQVINEAMQLAAGRGVVFRQEGKDRLNKALITTAAQGILLAEWRQAEEGPTAFNGPAAQVRASDVFGVYRLAEAMQRKLLPDLFAGVERRSPNFELNLLVPFCIALGFTLRLRLAPPQTAVA
jgi:hypothetical protein